MTSFSKRLGPSQRPASPRDARSRTPRRGATPHTSSRVARALPRRGSPSRSPRRRPRSRTRGGAMRAATPRPPPLPAGTETFEVTLDGSASLERQIRAALAAARARRRPREPPAPAAPHPRASRASLAAARGSALASIGKDVLARASFPGLTRDVVVVRATSPLERYKLRRARREQVNVLRRAKRTPRVVRTDADALDDLASTAHVYVTYDHPASRQTLAVARVLDPGDDRCASDAVDRRESSDDTNAVDAPEDETALRSLLDAARSWASKTEPTGPVYVVDKFFATGLSTVPDPVAFPKLCRALLLRGCEEIARRGGEGAGMLVAAPNGTLPDEALLLCDGHEDNGGSSARRVRDDSRRERRVGPSPLLKTTAFRVLARAEEDEAEDKASASGASASESSRPVSSEFERRPPPSVAELAAAHADRPRLVARAHRRVAEAVLGALAFENDRGAGRGRRRFAVDPARRPSCRRRRRRRGRVPPLRAPRRALRGRRRPRSRPPSRRERRSARGAARVPARPGDARRAERGAAEFPAGDLRRRGSLGDGARGRRENRQGPHDGRRVRRARAGGGRRRRGSGTGRFPGNVARRRSKRPKRRRGDDDTPRRPVRVKTTRSPSPATRSRRSRRASAPRGL